VAGVVTRDLDEVRHAFRRWWSSRSTASGVQEDDFDLEVSSYAGGGYSNEIIFVTITTPDRDAHQRERLVLRLPPAGPALFPTYDLAMQVAVQTEASAHGVPVAGPIIFEPDTSWLGTEFLVMPLVEGHCPGEAPALDPWLTAATVAQQRAAHEGFLDVVARIHTTPWRDRPLSTLLRGADQSLAEELQWWDHLLDWAFDGEPPAQLTAAFDWCRDHAPTDLPEASVLWGDVRLGNVIFDDGFTPVAVLDWEMASRGPAELDLAWFTALETMTEHFVGHGVPGFLTRDEIITRQEEQLGRTLVAFRWFEVFAMCRSSALNLRADRLDSQRRGKPPRPAEGNAVLTYTTEAIRALS